MEQRSKRLVWAIGDVITRIMDAVHDLEIMQRELNAAVLAEEKSCNEFKDAIERATRMFSDRLSAASEERATTK